MENILGTKIKICILQYRKYKDFQLKIPGKPKDKIPRFLIGKISTTEINITETQHKHTHCPSQQAERSVASVLDEKTEDGEGEGGEEEGAGGGEGN